MSDTKIYEELFALAAAGSMVAVQRSCGERKHGFVVAVSRQLLFLRQFNDFHVDGFCIVRLGDIEEIRSNAEERLWERMLAGERTTDTLEPAPELPIDSMRELLVALHERGENLTLECEFPADSEEEDEFFIGRIETVEPGCVLFRHFDAEGHWEEDASGIEFEEITTVQIDSPYCRIYSRYLDPADPD